MNELRKQAEEIFKQRAAAPSAFHTTNLQALMDELQILIIERTLQDDALRETQQACAQMERQYHALYTAAPVVYLTLDSHGQIRQANPNAADLFGFSVVQLLQIRFEQLVMPEDQPLYYLFMRQSVAPHPTQTAVELRLKTQGGQQFHANIHLTPLESGIEPRQLLLTITDVSERKRLEKERDELLIKEHQARLEAERANSLRLRFLDTISHELRTPLASIKGFSSTLLSDDITVEAAQQHDFIDIIDHEADRLTGLVNQLFDISRINVGLLRVSKGVIDFCGMIEEWLPQLQTIAKHHPLTLDCPQAVSAVWGDAVRLEQVMINLVDNAAKFSPAETALSIAVHLREYDIVVSVRDEGPGIPPDERRAVFEAFHQLDQKGGAGLGLAICKGLVEAHGGRIWIEENQPQGTIVYFALPRLKTIS